MTRLPISRRSLVAAAAGSLASAGVVAATVVGTPAGALAASTPSYKLVTVGAYGGEPSFVSDSKGVLYDSSPSGLPTGSKYPGSPPIYRSTNKGG